MSLESSVLTNGYKAMARYPFWIILGVTLVPQSPIFDSGTVIRFNHPTRLGLVWREFGVLSLDQMVLGNSQVSVLNLFKCDFSAPESNF